MRRTHALFVRFRRRLLVAVLSTSAAVPPVMAATAPSASAAAVATWENIAACESSGNWSINTGSGFYGGLQFTASTWAEFGGHQYAENAHQASKEQQIAIAEKVLAVQGPGAWPVCSAKAGLTTGGPAPEIAVGAETSSADVLDAPQAEKAETHGVFIAEKGDTITSLADRFGTTCDELYEENKDRVPADPDEPITPGTPVAHGARMATRQTQVAPQSPPSVSESSHASSGPADHATPEAASREAAPVAGGVITAAYKQPGAWAAGFHTGIDFAVPTGTSVKSVTSGTVISAGWEGSYGNAVVIQHDDGLYSLYAHLSGISVAPGHKTSAGEEIGLSGNTGNSTGPHLHFEVRTANTYNAHTDPLAYLHGIGVTRY